MSEHSLIVWLYITNILILNLQSAKELNSLSVTLQNIEKYEIITSSSVDSLQGASLRQTYYSQKFKM
jgi:hypothetical protein